MTELPAPDWPERPALFLDLDGTVLEFAESPEGVVRSQQLERILERIEEATDGAVAFISGRKIEELDRLLAPHRFAMAGVHGLECRDASGGLMRTEGFGVALSRAARRLEAWARRLEGTLVEDKSLAVAFHYRRRPDLADELAARFAELAGELDDELEVLEGHFVYEIKPRAANKGQAIGMFMQQPPFAGRTPVFIGDDVTDEAGFEAVNRLGGLSVKVGTGPTQAKAQLPNVEAVLSWLADFAGSAGPERRSGQAS